MRSEIEPKYTRDFLHSDQLLYLCNYRKRVLLNLAVNFMLILVFPFILISNRSMDQESTSLLVAAFDIGTTYSGYAFSFMDRPLQVITNQTWIAGGANVISLKAPTCILIDPNEKLHSFGFEAEDKYITLVEDEEQEGWRFFRNFKMSLYRNTVNSVFFIPFFYCEQNVSPLKKRW